MFNQYFEDVHNNHEAVHLFLGTAHSRDMLDFSFPPGQGCLADVLGRCNDFLVSLVIVSSHGEFDSFVHFHDTTNQLDEKSCPLIPNPK